MFALTPSGSIAWSCTNVGAINAAPAIGPDGTVYYCVATNLIAFSGSSPLMSSPWPMTRANPKHTGRSVQCGIRALRPLPDGNVTLSLLVETARTYQVEYSPNLQVWTPFTNFLSADRNRQCDDLTATNTPQRYYRLSTPRPW